MNLFRIAVAAFAACAAIVPLMGGATAAHAQFPTRPDYKSGSHDYVQGTLTYTQHYLSIGSDPNDRYTSDLTVSCPVKIFQIQGLPPGGPRPGMTKADLLPYLGDIYSIGSVSVGETAGGLIGTDPASAGAAIGAAAGVQGLATASFRSSHKQGDGSSEQISFRSMGMVTVVGGLQAEAPGADGLKSALVAAAKGTGTIARTDSHGKTSTGSISMMPQSFDYGLKLLMSKKELNAGYANAKSFRVQAHASDSRMEGPSHITVDGTLTLQVGVLAEDYEMEVIPQDGYEMWTPQAGADEDKDGNRMRFRVVLRTTDGKIPLYYPQKLTATLLKTSKEPGVCLNWPLVDRVAHGKTTPDLKLAADESQNPPITVADDGQTLTFGADACEEKTTFSFAVVSYDWGGYTKMKVEAEMPNGKKVVGYLTGKKTIMEIPIPYRKNPDKSHIADAFWATAGVAPKADDWDMVTQPGNSHDGDGLTAYEKYRGLWAKGKHVQLPLTSKVLVVENRLGEKISPAFDLFHSASGITAIELRDGELTENRVVNGNQSTAHKGDQYGLRVTPGTVKGSGSVAETVNVSGVLNDIPLSPKYCERLRIDKDTFDATKWDDADAAADTYSTIIHEMAHACHVVHHGPPPPSRKDNAKLVLIDRKAGTVYGDDDKENTTRPFVITGVIGLGHGDASGDVNCPMCYNHYYTWALPQGPGGSIYCNLGSRSRIGMKFCTSATGTEWNAPDHKLFPSGSAPIVMPLFGDAAVGNCMSQFQVKDY